MQRSLFPSCFVLFGLGVLSCQSGPSTSSSSNWFTCQMDGDCELVHGAVGCESGFCRDADGQRISQSGVGGAVSHDGAGGAAGGSSGSSTGTGASTSSGSGGSGAGGSGSGGSGSGSSGSGGSDTGGTGLGGEGTGGSALGEPGCDDLGTWAACTTDQDCAFGSLMTSCCGSIGLKGVNVNHVDDFEDLAQLCDSMWPACGCAPLANPELEDGRYLIEGDPIVACEQGRCRTMVGERSCGDSEACAPSELCLQIETVLGPQMSNDFRCVPNPCSGEALSCDCATNLCELEDGAHRVCVAPASEAADVLCQDTRQ